MADQLPRKYSQKALAVDNAVPSDIWYGSSPDSVVQPVVFAPEVVPTLIDWARQLLRWQRSEKYVTHLYTMPRQHFQVPRECYIRDR